MSRRYPSIVVARSVEEWVAAWKGYRVDGQGFLVPGSRKAAEDAWMATKAADIGDVKKYDPTAKLWIGGVANAHEVDRAREVLDPRGCDTRQYERNPIFLWMHDHDEPVGACSMMKPEDDGVKFEAWVGDPASAPLTATQVEARSLIAQRIIRAVSVGFIPHKIRMPAYDDDGNLVDPPRIEHWEMLELSAVSVPCNAGSLFDMKAGEGDGKKGRSQVVVPSGFHVGSRGATVKDNLKESEVEEIVKALGDVKSVLESVVSGIGKMADLQSQTLKAVDALKAPPPAATGDGDGKAVAAIDARLKAVEDVAAKVKAIEETATDLVATVKALIERLPAAS